MKYEVKGKEIVVTFSKYYISQVHNKVMLDEDEDAETRVMSAYLAGKWSDDEGGKALSYLDSKMD